MRLTNCAAESRHDAKTFISQVHRKIWFPRWSIGNVFWLTDKDEYKVFNVSTAEGWRS